MRTVSVRDLHIRTWEMLREAQEGEPIIIDRRGEPIAELRPFKGRRQLTPEGLRDILAERQRFRNQMTPMPDSTLTIEEDRNG